LALESLRRPFAELDVDARDHCGNLTRFLTRLEEGSSPRTCQQREVGERDYRTALAPIPISGIAICARLHSSQQIMMPPSFAPSLCDREIASPRATPVPFISFFSGLDRFHKHSNNTLPLLASAHWFRSVSIGKRVCVQKPILRPSPRVVAKLFKITPRIFVRLFSRRTKFSSRR
jgi:hypothetical protein